MYGIQSRNSVFIFPNMGGTITLIDKGDLKEVSPEKFFPFTKLPKPI